MTGKLLAFPERRRCPRCGDPLPPYPTAGSRRTEDRQIDICPSCGRDEAFVDNGQPPSRRILPAWPWQSG